MSLRTEQRNKILKQAKTGFVDLAAKHFLYEFRKELEHLEADQIVPSHIPVGKDLFTKWIESLLENNQSFVAMRGILENEKMLKEFAVQVAADIGESPTGVKNPMKGYEKKVDPTMVVAKKIAQKAETAGKGLYDTPQEHSRYCPDHPGSMLRRVKDNVYQCPISGDLSLSEPWKEKFSYDGGHTVEFATGVQNQTLDGWNYFHPVSPFLSPNKTKDMANINNVKGKEYDFEKLYGVSATPPPVSEYKKKTNKKDASILTKLFKASSKSYQLYAPTTMMTRQCPDHPGQQLQRLADNVRQCPLDNKVYDFEKGFETEDGEKHLGGSVVNQMAIPPGYRLSVEASLNKEATDASVHSFLYNYVLPFLPANAEYARRVLNYKFSQPGMSLDDALGEIRKADQLAEQAKTANLKSFIKVKK